MQDFLDESEKIAGDAWDWAEVRDVVMQLLQLPEDCVGFVGLTACALLRRQMGVASDVEITLIESLETTLANGS